MSKQVRKAHSASVLNSRFLTVYSNITQLYRLYNPKHNLTSFLNFERTFRLLNIRLERIISSLCPFVR